ncbi:MAG: carboxymuconolactone decarboxylase family protein [Gammaproteobacteria bacterium]|jgi:4-carboxymuconolactone decarboxylase
MSESERYERGAEVMQKLFGRVPEEGAMQEAWREITVKNLFGDIWTRPNLEIEERSLVTMAALTVLGREPELRIHLRGAKNLGMSREKVEEIMIHLAHYGGWPVAVGGMRAIAEVYGD